MDPLMIIYREDNLIILESFFLHSLFRVYTVDIDHGISHLVF